MNFRKYFLIISLAVSILICDLISTGLYASGKQGSEVSLKTPAVKRFLASLGEGDLKTALRGSQNDEPDYVIGDGTVLQASGTESTEAFSVVFTPEETETAAEPLTYSFTQVSEDYLEDALFIGNARCDSLDEWSELSAVTFFTNDSITLYKMLTNAFCETKDGAKTLAQVLQAHSYAKVYIEIGINELGYETPEAWCESYRQLISLIQSNSPDAIIFCCAIMHVSDLQDQKEETINNEAIDARNEALRELADDSSVFYIDINEYVSDENGKLKSEYTTDSLNLTGEYAAFWKQCILEHGIYR